MSEFDAIIGDENILVLAASPGDETERCGGLIAQCCRRGRPPFVMILSDRPDTGASAEREARAAMRCLGLPPERLLMVGLFEGTIPDDGPVYEAVVRAVTLVMWARDCNIICAPWGDSVTNDRGATGAIADAVVRRSDVGRIAYPAGDEIPPNAWRLDTSKQHAAKPAALAAYGRPSAPGMVEIFLPA